MEIKLKEKLLVVKSIQGTGENTVIITVIVGDYGEHTLEEIVLNDLTDEEYEKIMLSVKPGSILTNSLVFEKMDN